LSGWLELELQLTAGAGHLGHVQALSSAQLQSVHTLTSSQLDGSSSTDCAEPVFLLSSRGGRWPVAGREVRVGDQVKGGDSGPGFTAVSIKNQELSVSFNSSKSAGAVTQRVQLFSTSKGGCVGVGSRLLHPRNADFSKVLLNFKFSRKVWGK
jgi:hypothetical protein